MAEETAPDSGRLPGLHLAAIFAVAVVVRLVSLHHFRQIPFFYDLIVDSKRYHEWAMAIAGGDWIGQRPFYQAPLYPYLLGAFYTVAGESPVAWRIIQCIMGAVGCCLFVPATSRWFGRSGGLAAGWIAALYAPSVFFDTLIQKSVLDNLLLPASLLLIGKVISSPTRPRAVLTGAFLALLSLSRENAAAFLPILVTWLLFTSRRAAAPRFHRQAAGLLLAGAALVLLPVWLRNASQGDPRVVTTYQAGTNFYMGNSAAATGSYTPLVPDRGSTEFEETDAVALAQKATGRSLQPHEVSNYWFRRTATEIAADPGRWLKLTATKLGLALNRSERIDTDDIYFFEHHSPLLMALNSIMNFGLLLPLAAFGMVAVRPASRDARILLWLAAAMLASLVAFYVVARYRHALSLLLIPYAGAALAQWRTVIRFHPKRFALGATAAVAAGIVSSIPLFKPEEQLAVSFYNAAGASKRLGRLKEADEYMRLSMRTMKPGPSHYLNYGMLLTDLGHLDEAKGLLAQAALHNADAIKLNVSLGNLALMQGDTTAALASYAKARHAGARGAQIDNSEAAVLIRAGRHGEAEEKLLQALADKPDYANAYRNLLRVYHLTDNTTGIAEVVHRARASGLDIR